MKWKKAFFLFVIFVAIAIGFFNTKIGNRIGTCIPPLISCIGDVECREGLMCFSECSNLQDPKNSERLKKQVLKFNHTQNPEDPMICLLECLDEYPSEKMGPVMECSKSFMPQSNDVYKSDECLENPKKSQSFRMEMIEGTWWKLFANSWDIWECQKSIFRKAINSETPEEVVWMQDVLYKTFPKHREPQMQIVEEKVFPSKENDIESFSTELEMYGTKTYEKWHVLDYVEDEFFLIYVCANTVEFQKIDSIVLVLSKTKNLSTKNLERVKSVCEENNLDFNSLIPIDNNNC